MPSSSASRTTALSSPLWALPLLAACTGPAADPEPPTLRTIGSSTVGHFIRDADEVYEGARFVIDTEPESAGGVRAILERTADLAGVADRPSSEVLKAGAAATLIGRDAIAVIVHADNPLSALTSSDLRGIFTGRIER